MIYTFKVTPYCLQMYLKTEICELDPANFLPVPGLAWQACLKKQK